MALLFAQISSRWAGLQDQIVLETRSAPQVRPAQRSGMAQGARCTPSLRCPTGLRGIGGAWKWADLRPFRIVRGLSRIPNIALPCLDPVFSPFRAQARLCSWPGAICARARGRQGTSCSRVAAPRCCSSRGVHHLRMQKRRRDGRQRAILRCLLLCCLALVGWVGSRAG